jgi:hypothetical protein
MKNKSARNMRGEEERMRKAADGYEGWLLSGNRPQDIGDWLSVKPRISECRLLWMEGIGNLSIIE